MKGRAPPNCKNTRERAISKAKDMNINEIVDKRFENRTFGTFVGKCLCKTERTKESKEVAVDNTAENGSATKAHQPTLLTASAPANQIGSAVSGGVGVNGIYSTVRGTPKTC